MSTEVRPRGTGPLTSRERNFNASRPPAAPPPLAEEVAARKKAAPAALYPPRKMSSSEFNTAMIHFYRGEIQRANAWRNRLDTTTNWAVITAGATLSFAFGNENAPHFVIIINSLIVAFFLFMEARRYRYYEIWASRVRVLETAYIAPMLAHDEGADERWAEHMARDLITPHFTISEWEAVGRRLRRNYWWIFALLASAWNLKVYLHPHPAETFSVFLYRATVGLVPGALIFTVGILFNLTVIIFALATMRLRDATGEVLPQHEFSFHPFRRVTVWRRASTTRRRADKARQRVKKFDTTEIPNRRTDVTDAPNRRLEMTDVPNRRLEVTDVPNRLLEVTDVPNRRRETSEAPQRP